MSTSSERRDSTLRAPHDRAALTRANYRNYAFPGTLVLKEQIPSQYTDAKREDPDIKTVVMTGGGNDILSTSCPGECKDIVDRVSVRLDQLMSRAATSSIPCSS